MPWRLRLADDPSVIELTCSGQVRPEELYSALVAATAAAKKGRTRLFLADCSGMEGGHSIMDLYGLISLYESSGVDRSMREAIILPPLEAPTKVVEFYKETCRNQGFDVRLFHARSEALEWLKG